jgi:hypothetical protein
MIAHQSAIGRQNWLLGMAHYQYLGRREQKIVTKQVNWHLSHLVSHCVAHASSLVANYLPLNQLERIVATY